MRETRTGSGRGLVARGRRWIWAATRTCHDHDRQRALRRRGGLWVGLDRERRWDAGADQSEDEPRDEAHPHRSRLVLAGRGCRSALDRQLQARAPSSPPHGQGQAAQGRRSSGPGARRVRPRLGDRVGRRQSRSGGSPQAPGRQANSRWRETLGPDRQERRSVGRVRPRELDRSNRPGDRIGRTLRRRRVGAARVRDPARETSGCRRTAATSSGSTR